MTDLVTRRFNPRAREGATWHRPSKSSVTFCFNPRAREGATRQIEANKPGVPFQSTRP